MNVNREFLIKNKTLLAHINDYNEACSQVGDRHTSHRRLKSATSVDNANTSITDLTKAVTNTNAGCGEIINNDASYRSF